MSSWEKAKRIVEDFATSDVQKYGGPSPSEPLKSDLTGGMRVALTREEWNLVVDALGTAIGAGGFDKDQTYDIINSIWSQLKTQRK